MAPLLPSMKTRDLNSALRVFRDKGGTLRTRDLIASGVHTDALYALHESGQIVELGRGLYRLAEVGEAEYPDLAVVAARAPNAAVCLTSALSYHDITTQIPTAVHLAVPRDSYYRIKLSIPVTVYRFDPKTFHAGLETHRIGRMPLKIYSVARTVVDWVQVQEQARAGCRARGAASRTTAKTCAEPRAAALRAAASC